jgi:glycosyltransferase involved in cell wall biosynthesis
VNIGLIHYSAPPVVGGVESVLGQHARLMADAGHSVRIIAGRGDQVDPRVSFQLLPLADSRHPELAVVKASLDTGHIPPGFEPLVVALVQALESMTAGLDILIAHNVCSLNKNLALTAALHKLGESQPRPRLVLWHHDLAWTTPRYRGELHDGYPWDLLRTAWPGATQVVVSELRQRELAGLLGLPPERIAVVPNGVDAVRFLKLEEQTQRFVQQLNLLAAAPILLLPVRITPRKNIELALQVLARLRENHPQAALVVTGPLGPHNPANVEYFNRLKALRAQLGLQGAAHFLTELTDDLLPDAVIADFYRLADTLFLPSLEEGFGLPVLEAGLEGLPVFCTDIPPLRALAGDQACYFPIGADPGDVASRLGGYLAGDPVYELRCRVRQRFTWEGVYARYIAPLLSSLRPA